MRPGSSKCLKCDQDISEVSLGLPEKGPASLRPGEGGTPFVSNVIVGVRKQGSIIEIPHTVAGTLDPQGELEDFEEVSDLGEVSDVDFAVEFNLALLSMGSPERGRGGPIDYASPAEAPEVELTWKMLKGTLSGQLPTTKVMGL